MATLPSGEAMAIYNYFKSLPGSEHIGKPVSIEALIGMCREYNPSRILEMGGGVGAISYTLLKHSQAFLDIYEDNDFCIGELRKNLKEFEGRFQIIETYRMLPPAKSYDIVVIDGGTGAQKDGGYPLAAQLFLMYLDSVRSVYIEGYRGLQRNLVFHTLQKKYACSFVVYKEIFFEGKKWAGGLKITCRKTNSQAGRWLMFIFWEAVVWLRKQYFRLRALYGKMMR
ncbi:hypothetical protein A2477_03750 [Candidatus Falkowbacteria bacterium RIFOXYC2_FULL_47_12]|uniref:Methyltransferase small domain-containing protein n=2 Tax=Candidatus Falkowiibacteriota TaxID=1752728 RepID=A0A1F5TPZ2_9BACT|nr:MAG: hypothetical protein A2242_03725 [Candidatus Falkowbacteria bacterium RIFOXYA2_FULL_47_9]OGF40591.1 MAG: hypothetical protein A2477_03750 [Candidatus Falkowbacteria bacterium RIFOXYC2_FULL_47_12]